MAGVLSNKKKIRGWRRRVKQIEHWKTGDTNNLREFSGAYCL